MKMNFRTIVHLAIYLLGAHNASGGFLTLRFQGSLGSILGTDNGFSVWALSLRANISNPFFEGWCDIAYSTGSMYERLSREPCIIMRVYKPFAKLLAKFSQIFAIAPRAYILGTVNLIQKSVTWVLVDQEMTPLSVA